VRPRIRDRRPVTGWLGLLMALVFVLGQQAALAHACARGLPMPAPAAPAEGSVDGSADRSADLSAAAPLIMPMACEGHGAEGPAPEQRLLCKAHCQADEQSVNSAAAAPDLPAADLLGLVPWHQPQLGDAAHVVRPVPRARPTGPPAGAPPLYLSLLVLRN
jgi:hypothetical protein